MSALRSLSVVYLLCALAFGTAIVLDRHPALKEASRQDVAALVDGANAYVMRPAADLIWGKPAPKTPEPHTEMARVAPKPMPMPVPQKPEPAAPPVQTAPAPPVDVDRDDDSSPAPPPPETRTAAARPPALYLVPVPTAPSPTNNSAISPAELTRVTLRLKQSLTREMYDNFSLFLYVSKASDGPWAQHLFVFRKDTSGDLAMLYAWPASTGREKDEMAPNGTRQPSVTPRGYFQLDPDRMYKVHYSGQWHEPMPHAMFFNWEHDGLQTGLAIHGAVGLEVAQLGSRASAGCIRISPDNAALLFNLIRGEYKGLAPRFAYDRRTATMNNDGLFMHDPSGNLQMAQGYKVLVFVEDYGGENVVAALF